MSNVPSATTSEASQAWTSLPGGVVDGGEIVILAIKPSLWRPLFDSLGPLVMSGVLGVMVAWWGRSFPGLSVMATAQFVLLLGMVPMAVAIIRWVPTWYVLTNRRVMNVHGVRVARISSCLLVDVRNTYLNAGPLEKLAGLATISFATDQAGEALRQWRSIARPIEVHEKIRRAIENAIDQQEMAG